MDNYNRNVLTKINKDQKRAAKNQRIASKRPLKNFLWWLLGFFSSFLIFAGSVAICVCVLPASTFFGNDGKYIDKSVASSSLLQIALSYQSYQVKDFPIIEELLQSVLASSGVDKYFEIDYEKLDDIKFSDINFQYIYENCIDITATIENLGMTSALGEFANLKVMTENTKVEGTVDTSASDFNPKIYYYEDDNGNLKRAYDDEKNLVSGAEGKQLYYPALVKVPVDEMIEILPDRLGQSQVIDLLAIFTEVSSDSLISKVFGTTLIKDMGSFDPEKIKLIDILPDGIEEEDKLFKILCDAASVEGADPLTKETITVGDLKSVDFNKITLTSVIPEDEGNKTLFEILKAVTNKDDSSKITIGDLQTFNTDNIRLSSVLDMTANAQLFDIFSDVTGKSDKESITIGDLSSMDTDKIHITTFIEKNSSNKEFFDMIESATGKEASEITLGDIANTDIKDSKLAKLIPYEGNEDLAEIIVSALGSTKSYEEVTLGDLMSGDFDTGRIKLSKIGIAFEQEFKDIIVAGIPGKDNFDDIVLSDFSSFNIDNVKLSLLIDESDTNNETFITLLVQITGKTFAQLTIGDIRSGLNFDNAKLTTFVPDDSANADLYAVLKDALNVSDASDITLGNLKSGIDFNNVKLTSIVPNDASSEKLYDILTQCYGVSANEITIQNLKNGINFDNVKLASIISPTDETTGETTMLYTILCQSLGVSDPNSIKVSDLSAGINTDNIKLTTVMPVNADNTKLYDILLEQSGRSTYEDILISDLKNGIDFNSIKLNTVITSSDNEVIAALLEDDSVTLGNFGQKINELSLYDLYGSRCFTTNEAEALGAVKADKYKRIENADGTYSYEYDAAGEYYISKEAGFMLLLAFDVSEVNSANGRANKYVPSVTTYEQFAQADTMGNVFKKATVYQLIAAGIVDDNGYSDNLKKMTLQDILDLIDTYLTSTPTFPSV